jgi:uncharacterized protein YbjT (DUF2867 family)
VAFTVSERRLIMFVVAGVTGNTGSVVAETLLSQKKPVRVLVRDAAKGAPWKAKGAEVAIGSIEDGSSLTAALQGATGAYFLLPPPPITATGIVESRRALADQIVEATRASGLRHVVLLSSVGAQHEKGTGPIRPLHYAEAKLSALGIDTTFLRAAYFMENWRAEIAPALGAGIVPTLLTPSRKIPMVATRDIGTTAARALVEGGRGRRVIELVGPTDYSPEDVASTLARLIGKPIHVAPVPNEAFVAALMGMGFGKDLAELFLEMGRGVNEGIVGVENAAHVSRGNTPLEDVLRVLLARAGA